MLHPVRYCLILICGLILAACGNADNGIGPSPTLLHGTWAQDGPAQADPDMVVDRAIVTYRPDGTSSFKALMTVTVPNSPPVLFDIDVGVLWTLEETVVTRTLDRVTVTPQISTPDAEAFADQLEAAYRASPPGRLIVQYVDPNELIFLDPDTGAMLRYIRAETAN